MVLILGGAYQGKLEYAKKTYHLRHTDIFTCEDETVNFSTPCIDRIERFTLSCVQSGIDPLDEFQKHRSEWSESIFIVRDIFCGVVPTDASLRQWRQETGRLCQYLAAEADSVVRIFCGLEQHLK